MKIFTITLLAAAALSLTACSKPETDVAKTGAAQSATTPPSYDSVAAQGTGFTVGALMAANPVYVLFDPQCPHCSHLWEAAKPLFRKVKFVWMPVSIINGNSAPQGAALISAPNPTELMNTHETSILAGTGGIKVTAGSSTEAQQAIKKNTELFNAMRIESVPYIMAKNLRTGQVVSHSGSLSTQGLADFLGVE